MAPEGAVPRVLRHVHPLGDSPRRCLAYAGARVPKVLPSAELEGILAGLIIAVPLEPAGGAAVSNDAEEPQELAVEPPGGGDDCHNDAGEEGVLEFSVAGPVARHLGASDVLEDAVGLRITECPIATDVCEVIATEFVVDGNVENQVAVTAKVDVFEHQVPPRPRLLRRFCTEGMLRRSVVIPACRQMALIASGMVSWAVFRLPVCCLQIWMIQWTW